MGFFYKTMINDMTSSFEKSSFKKMEDFLKEKEEYFSSEYKIGGVLLYANINEAIRRVGQSSEYYAQKQKEAFDSEFDIFDQ